MCGVHRVTQGHAGSTGPRGVTGPYREAQLLVPLGSQPLRPKFKGRLTSWSPVDTAGLRGRSEQSSPQSGAVR